MVNKAFFCLKIFKVYVWIRPKQKVYRHPSSYRKHINSEHYELRNKIGLDAEGVFIPDKQSGDLSPSKVYTKVFGSDGYMEIG